MSTEKRLLARIRDPQRSREDDHDMNETGHGQLNIEATVRIRAFMVDARAANVWLELLARQVQEHTQAIGGEYTMDVSTRFQSPKEQPE